MSQLSIPTDNVDEEYIKKPRPWNIESIKRFMVFIGPLSSIFDFTTFFVFYWIFRAVPAQFQTAWFIESLTTQILIVYIIRTNKIPIIESRPSLPVVFTTLFVVLLGLTITMLPVGQFFGFEPLPFKFIATIYGIVTAYIVLTFFAKKKLMQKFNFE